MDIYMDNSSPIMNCNVALVSIYNTIIIAARNMQLIALCMGLLDTLTLTAQG